MASSAATTSIVLILGVGAFLIFALTLTLHYMRSHKPSQFQLSPYALAASAGDQQLSSYEAAAKDAAPPLSPYCSRAATVTVVALPPPVIVRSRPPPVYGMWETPQLMA
ncbi:hypothetical protein CALCODRAFT_510305 [Calocera cornea HHB12733]|uniref:Uncharacterized protein n=1 Tax=Calocera cornea HHB12733 TaxID=1353952 RepID=A0A165EMQ4_9BASI|nr:hypothetical protein CALCODRAFT_510305 [Calocera cornea HHB12733]